MAPVSPFAVRRPGPGLAVCAALLVLLAFAGLAGTAASARAGTWTLVSCTQPDGAPAPTDGWAPGVWAGEPIPGGGVVNGCAAGGSLTAVSSATAPVASFTGPEWTFTAPAGTTIGGGTITASLTAPEGQAWIATPSPAFDAADVITACPPGGPCGPSGVLAGTFPITHPGGTRLYAPALCSQPSAAACPVGAVPNAEVDIHAADIELTVDATPQATGFGGSLLRRRATGVADLRFTASDPQRGGGSGPGIYGVVVEIDGKPVYSGVPDTDHGTCVSLGVDPASGGQEFDDMQPCAPRASIALPVDTRGLSDGPHRLTVIVGDAGGDTSTVRSGTITTFNPVQTPMPRTGLATQLSIGYMFAGAHTTIDSVVATGLPARGHLAVACLGPQCPAIRPDRVRVARVGRLWSALKQASFTAGEQVQITVTAPHHAPEQIQLRIRAGRRPGQRLLGIRPAA